MPRVPPSTQLGQAQVRPDTTPFQRFQTTADDFGAGTGKALVTAGGQLLDISDELSKRALALAEANNKAAALNAFNDAVREYQLKSSSDGGLYSQSRSELFSDGASPKTHLDDTDGVLNKISNDRAEKLKNQSQKSKFSTLWSTFSRQSFGSAAKHLAGEFRGYREDTENRHLSDMEDRYSQSMGSVVNNWRTWRDAQAQGDLEIAMAVEMGIDPNRLGDLVKQRDRYLSTSMIRGYVMEQGRGPRILQDLIKGEFDEPEIQTAWDSMSEDTAATDSLKKSLVKDYKDLTSLNQDLADKATDARKKSANQQSRNFWLAGSAAEQEKIFEAYKNSPDWTDAEVRAMQEAMVEGDVEDDQVGLAGLESLIRRGEVTTYGSAAAFARNGKRVASAETLRTRIFPMLDSVADKDFNNAMKWGRSGLGVPEGLAVTSEVTAARVGQYESRMQRWRKDNPDEDPWAQGNIIMKEVRDQFKADPQVIQFLRAVKRSMEEAAKSGDVEKAAKRRSFIIGQLQDYNLDWSDINE